MVSSQSPPPFPPKPPRRFDKRLVLLLPLLGMGAVLAWKLISQPPSSRVDRSIVPEGGRFGNQPRSAAPIAVPPPRIPVTDLATAQEPLPIQPPLIFSDVPPEHWARAVLDDLSARGLLTGFPEGTFEPEQPMLRAELSAQIARIFALPAQAAKAQFVDVEPDHWAAASIRRAVQMGFLTGLPEGRFGPEQTVTKAEVLVAIANGLSLTTTAHPETVLQRYRDRADIPAWAVSGLVATTQAGLVINYPNVEQLEPNRAITRAEAAAILHQALVYLGQINEIPSPYRVAP
ncbi:MAG: S-layer homology domain-containing protein [Cyanobacteria bacterium Co-bin13]|nr:S-layer homology domain-containing protein [Cyanobacteria bacterium Co-bin13]